MKISINLDRQKIKDTVIGLAATGGGSGLIPFYPDIIGTILGGLLWWLLRPKQIGWQLVMILGLYLLGFFTSREAEDWWQQNDRRIVIDEMAGIWLALWSFERNPWVFLIGLGLFLFINLVKFYPAFVCQRWGPGWGLMMEKSVVGAYTGVLLSVAALFFTRFPTYEIIFARVAVYGTVLAAAVAAHLYGSVAGGLRVLTISSAAYLFLKLAPSDPLRQLILIAALGLCSVAAVEAVRSQRDRWRPWFEYLFVFWGTWAALWFLPRMSVLYMLAVPIIILFRYLRPLPANYLPPWNPGPFMLAVNLISAAYASAVIQVGVMIFLPEAMVFIKYLALRASWLLIRIIH